MFKKCNKSIKFGEKCYILASTHSSKHKKENTLHFLKIFLKNEEKVNIVKKDEDWLHYLKAHEFIEIIKNTNKIES